MSEQRIIGEVRYPDDWISADDLYLFSQGRHFDLWRKLGCHLTADGAHFATWAPKAELVSVLSGFNEWSRSAHPLKMLGDSGIWAGFVPGVRAGDLYKLYVHSGANRRAKADPFAFWAQEPPSTASVVWRSAHDWDDRTWMSCRKASAGPSEPMSIYELHLGSWRRPAGGEGYLSYEELAEILPEYVADLGFTHVELMPVMEHPYDPSWGYQITGFFAPTSRFGSPDGLRTLIDALHERGLGVILDWVPSHFPADAHGLARFDGSPTYEHADTKRSWHPDWKSFCFDYDKAEVRSFLISNALYWIEQFHVDGLRVDAVASMLQLDYSRPDGQWLANEKGGRENLGAVQMLQVLNEEVASRFPGVFTIAEESTTWPGVTHPVYAGGLGFSLKWDMGWMHDTLKYMQLDPIHRRFHHRHLTFRMMYAYSERFMLPLSHDEVVHGKASLLGKMHGPRPWKFAQLRALYAWMWGLPGKKLLFMGGEIGQWSEWSHEGQVEWELLEHPPHQGLQSLLRDLNKLYSEEPALATHDYDQRGFEWIDCSDTEQSVVSFMRWGADGDTPILAVFNFTPVTRRGYRVGAVVGGRWIEMLNTDADGYGGSGQGNCGAREAEDIEWHGRPASLSLTLPGLSAVFLKPTEPVVRVFETPPVPDPEAVESADAEPEQTPEAAGKDVNSEIAELDQLVAPAKKAKKITKAKAKSSAKGKEASIDGQD